MILSLLKNKLSYYNDLRLNTNKVFLKRSYSGPPTFWVGHYLDPLLAKDLALIGGEKPEDLHITLAFCGSLDQYSDVQRLMSEAALSDFGCKVSPLVGTIAGIGRFTASESSDGLDVIYASVDIPGLSEFRQNLIRVLESCGIVLSKDHDFTPHITLKFVSKEEDIPLKRLEKRNIILDNFTLDIGRKITINLG